MSNVSSSNSILIGRRRGELVRPWCRLALLAGCLGIGLSAGPLVPAAYATCGDWLAHPAPLLETLASTSVPLAHGSAADRVAIPERRLPCDGPQCRRSSDLPTLPVPVRVDRPVKELADTHLDAHCLCMALGRAVIAEADLLPSRGFPARVERPPRS